MDGKYTPSGELQGDTKEMPDRGCTTGFQGGNHGADFGVDVTNAMGSLRGDTWSDAPNARHRSGEYDGKSSGNAPGDQFNGTLGGLGGE